ncbi:MAG TPA: DUF2079 domain-containing protein [Bacteroidia bacterium]|nr:DUF2079 domain-containing protein [Bacteroidia bacterium]
MIQSFLHTIKRNKIFVLINAVFLIVYSLICFVNHYNFRTYSLDLGIYTRAVYDYAHCHFNYAEIFKTQKENILGDHFDPILILISPLYYLFGTYVLLVVQIAFIHVGAFGVYKIAAQQLQSKKLALITITSFLAFYGILSALSFDVHTNVFAAMLIPWLFYFFTNSNWRNMFIAATLVLICKENMALWLIFIGFGLAWLYYKERQKRNIALIISLISVIYFVGITMVIMPALSVNGSYAHMHYAVLGNSFSEILGNLFKHPLTAIAILFKNHSSDSACDYYKIETHIFVLLSGGFLLFLKPQYLLMLVPIYFQKMFHNSPIIWSVSMHYNIEFAPILILCFIAILSNLKSERKQLIFSLIYLALTVAVTIRLCDHTIGFVDKTRIRFYQADHYESDFDNKVVYADLKKIPTNAVVSAENMFVPHLTDRKMVYQYPIVKNAQYILLSDDIHSYPVATDKMLKQIDSLSSSANWHLLPTNNHVFLFEMIEKH